MGVVAWREVPHHHYGYKEGERRCRSDHDANGVLDRFAKGECCEAFKKAKAEAEAAADKKAAKKAAKEAKEAAKKAQAEAAAAAAAEVTKKAQAKAAAAAAAEAAKKAQSEAAAAAAAEAAKKAQADAAAAAAAEAARKAQAQAASAATEEAAQKAQAEAAAAAAAKAAKKAQAEAAAAAAAEAAKRLHAGTLKVKVSEAKNLPNKDTRHKWWTDKTDAFVKVKVGSQKAETPHIAGDHDPKWDWEHSFEVEASTTDQQLVSLEAWDHDLNFRFWYDGHDEIGDVQVPFRTLPLGKWKHFTETMTLMDDSASVKNARGKESSLKFALQWNPTP